MVGKAVLIECLENNLVGKILIINRQKVGLTHPKIKEILLSDFSKLNSIKNHFKNYNACFHCMGISAVGVSEKTYKKVIFDITKNLVDILYSINKNIVFNFVSGEYTDTSEKGNIMWARVKGMTENYILKKGFKNSFMFRLGFMIPEKGINSRTRIYNFLYYITKPIYPILKISKNITTTTKLGQAMINTMFTSSKLVYLSNKEINIIANEEHY